jgi:hypothetical protein
MENKIELFEAGDSIKHVEEFMEVLGFPMEHEDGFLNKFGEVSYDQFIKGTKYEPGYDLFKADPSISNIKEVRDLLYSNGIKSLEIKEDGLVFIEFREITKEEWEQQEMTESFGMGYDEYLGSFGKGRISYSM